MKVFHATLSVLLSVTLLVSHASSVLSLRDQLALAEKNEDTHAQIELIRRLLDQEPGDSELREQLTDLWLSVEDYDMAEATVREWRDAPEVVRVSVLAAVLFDAAPLWAAVMRSLYAAGDRPWPQVEEGAVLHPVEIAAETGLLPRSGEPIVREWFLKGTEPLECASTLYVNGVLQLPTEYLAWCAGPQNRLGATVRAMPLRILFPENNATFCYNATMPKSQQMLPLQSSWPECQWFLNGRRLEQTLIPLERGTWTITAKAGGETAVANYVVE